MLTTDGITISSNGHDIPTDFYRELTDHSALLHDGDAMRRAMRDDGYVFLRGVLDAEAVMAARAEVFGRLVEVGEVAEPAADAIHTGGSRREEVVDDLGKFWRSVCEGPRLRAVTHGGPIVEIMERLHDEPVRAFDFLWLRAMVRGRASAFHFDHVYMNRGTDRLYTIWTPLGEAPLTDGPLLVIENSHTFTDLIDSYRGLDVDRDTSRPGHVTLDPVELAQERGVKLLSASFRPGDVIALSMFTLHGSLDNNSPINRVRLSSDTRYQPASQPMDPRFAGPNPIAHGSGYGGMSGAQPMTAPLIRR